MDDGVGWWGWVGGMVVRMVVGDDGGDAWWRWWWGMDSGGDGCWDDGGDDGGDGCPTTSMELMPLNCKLLKG